jgi:protein-S-isoprenylcysteine O-methyltransferase Ste14
MTDLSSRAWGGMLRSLLMLGVLLFLSAGTLDYWQAWMYWLLYAAALGFNTAYFLRHDPALIGRRLHAGPAAEPSPSQRRIQAVTAICLLLMFVLAGLQRRLSWPALPAIASVIAAGVFVLALAMVFMVFRQNSYAGSTVDVVPGQTIATRGLYGSVRHPMYAASAIAFLATPAALGSTWGWIGAVPATMAIIVRLRDEERQLLQRLPDYAAYCQTVRFRLLPGIW